MPCVMRKILLPTDFSDNSINAIRYAIELFRDEACTFYVLNVYRVPFLTNPDISYFDNQNLVHIEKSLQESSIINLNKLLDSIRENSGSKHDFKTISKYNFLVDAVKEVIKEEGIDLIVMGTKGATGAKEIFMGSNTGDIIMKVDCNILAVPERVTYSDPKEIAFPTDFRIDYTPDELECLTSIARKNDAFLRVLHIQNYPLNKHQNENREKLENLLKDKVNYRFYTLTNIDFDTALNCFTQSRGDIDMIAIIARHYGFFERLFFRPKVEELSFHTKVPLLVLHKKE
jgi:nucleotide-binding universal stress UspA family protein